MANKETSKYRFAAERVKHTNWILDRVAESVFKKEFTNLLTGSGKYFFENREIPCTHDYGIVLYSGIYRYYECDNAVKNLFEKALLQLIDGMDYSILVAFDYIWRQRRCELRGTAPFTIDESCVEALRERIKEREDSLKLYKEHYHWGSSLQDGAWEYICNIVKSIKDEYVPETDEQHFSKDEWFLENNDELVQNLEVLVTDYDGFDSYVSLCIDKTTHEAYITKTKSVFQGAHHLGSSVTSKIDSFFKATYAAAMSIVEKEYDSYSIVYSQVVRNDMHKTAIINGNSYCIGWFVVIDDIEISLSQIFFGQTCFEVPAQFLTNEQHTKYAEYYTHPGPYEHCFNLPVACCQKLIRKLLPLEF